MTAEHRAGALPRGLVVSCQARPDNPLHGPVFMAAMALAAAQGGAAALRVHGSADIQAVKAVCALPIVGLIKRRTTDDEVHITPRPEDATFIARAGATVVALEATDRRSDADLKQMIAHVHSLGLAVLADIATLAEGRRAAALGADAVATTMHGYTPSTASQLREAPELTLVGELVRALPGVPVWAEGRYATPAQVGEALALGARAVVVGTAITNPRELTRRFSEAIRPVDGSQTDSG